MDEKIVFQAEITFKGGIEEFKRMAEALADLPIAFRVPGWPLGHETAGCWPEPIQDLISKERFGKLLQGAERFKISKLICRDLCGGIRVPHVHLPPDEVVLLDRRRFKELVGGIAEELGQRVADTSEYSQITSAMRDLAHLAK